MRGEAWSEVTAKTLEVPLLDARCMASFASQELGACVRELTQKLGEVGSPSSTETALGMSLPSDMDVDDLVDNLFGPDIGR